MQGIVLGVVGLVITAIGVVYARKQASPPKRLLKVDASPPAPLLSADSAAGIGIEVTRRGIALKNPNLITLTLDCDGDYDVARTSFDNGQPIALDLGVPIIELLQHKEISASFDGTELYLGPDLIKKGSRASLLLLVDGLPSLDTLATQMEKSLVDVKVETASQSVTATRRGLLGVVAVIGAGVVVTSIGFLIWAFIEDTRGTSAHATPDHGAAGTQVRLVGDRYAEYEVVDFQGDYDTATAEGEDLDIPSAQADKDGHWVVTFTVPTDAEVGEISIQVEGSKFSADYIDFDVVR